jgi:TRAP-type mannitol/chloroaromatic compound transport system substrate-binding protein
LFAVPAWPVSWPPAAPAIVHAQANIRWRLASSFPKSLDTIYGAAECSPSAQVRSMSGGKFQITVHAAGELCRPSAWSTRAGGTVEMATPRRTTSSARTRPSRSAAPSPSA